MNRRIFTTRLSAFLGCLAGIAQISACGPNSPHPVYTPSPQELAWEQCHRAEVDDRGDAAVQCYAELCDQDPTYQRACYDLSRALFDMNKTERARQAAIGFVVRFGQHALAPAAVKRVRRSFSSTEAYASGIVAFRALAAKTSGRDVHDTVLFELAKLLRDAGKTEAEIMPLQQLVTTYDRWESQLWDDAMWRLIQIYKASGNALEEEQHIEALLATRESSWAIGSYNSPFHDDALLRLGYIYFERGSHDRAKACFEELAAQETSRLSDDALLGLARVERAGGRKEAACRLLQRIASMTAASERRRAADMRAAMGCS